MTMRGWRVVAPSQLEFDLDLARPTLDGAPAGSVVLDVEAAAVNFADSLMVAGTYQERPRLPFTPGLEVVGRIRDGHGNRYAHDQRVVGLAEFGVGSWAEQCRADQAKVVAVPDGVPSADALAIHVNAQTAWFALHRRARVQSGDRVLVHAAAGGVGSMTVQLAHAAGATVVATCSDAKRSFVERLGVEVVVDNRDPDWPAQVRSAVAGVDVVVDPVGGELFAASMKLLEFEGRIVTVGFTSGTVPTVSANHVLVKNISIEGLYWTRYTAEYPDLVEGAASEIFDLYAAGALDPCLTSQARLADAEEQMRAVATGTSTGKSILVVDSA